MAQQDFSGTWHFTHWYPSADDAKEESGEYDLVAHPKGDDVVFESTKATDHGTYMLVRLKINGHVATGTWYENASLDGSFDGAEYSAAGQMIMNEDGSYMDGMWAGAGMDRAAGKLKVYTGRWELKRLS